MRQVAPFRQSGVSMVETLLIFPIVMMIALWIIHLGLVYQARSNLEYAALMGARIGAVTHIDIDRMRNEIVRRMEPSTVGPSPVNAADVSIQILNPTNQMFTQCGVFPLNPAICDPAIATCEIPNFGLQFRSTAASCDGVNIQDANILRIRVSYRFDSRIPFMNMKLFPTDVDDTDGDDPDPGTLIHAIATVRMQTSAIRTPQNQGAFL